jgi:hypothetical protein
MIRIATLAAAAVFAATPAFAALDSNGMGINALTDNGLKNNGLAVQGIQQGARLPAGMLGIEMPAGQVLEVAR